MTLLSLAPCQVQQAFLSKDLTRAQKTHLVNNAVHRDDAGTMSLQTDSQVVQSLVSHTETTKGQRKAQGFTKMVMAAKLGGESALCKPGEVNSVVERGVTYYFFNSIEITRGTETKSQVSAKQVTSASDSTVDALRGFVETFNSSLCLESVSVLSRSYVPSKLLNPDHMQHT